jgi:hypothetical protein
MRVGIVVEERHTDNKWQPVSWHAIAVLPGAPEVEAWHELRRADNWVQFHAVNLEIELFGKETEGYKYNLSNETPVVYVVLRDDEESTDERPMPEIATVCPYEAQDYLDSGDELVEPVPMPDDIRRWVGRFVDEHHVDEKFHKRQRKRYDPEEVGFGRRPRYDA